MVVLALAAVWIFATASLAMAGNGTFQDLIGLILATGIALFAGADFLHDRYEYLALSLRVTASLMSVVAFVALMLRAASVIGAI